MLQIWEKCAITFFCVLILGLAVWIYTLTTKNTSSTSPTGAPTVSPTPPSGLPTSFKGVYLYSTVKNSLYLLTPDGKYYSCGNLTACPNILSQDTPSYEIADITRLYSCLDKSQIPDKYVKACDGNATGWITAVLQSADDLEKFIASNISGTITPPVDVCYAKVQIPGDGPGFFAKLYTGLEDFLATNGATIGELAVLALAGKAEASATEIVAFAGKWVGNFVLFGMVLQGFLGAYGSGGNEWDRQKAWLMSGQILTHKVVGWIGERVAQLSKGEVAEMVETADGSIFDVALQVGQKCVDSVLTEFSDVIGSMIAGASSLLEVVAVVQLLGMFLDMVDPCNLNDPANNLTQESINQVQQASDMGLSINLHGLDKVVWDPLRNFCDFPLVDPATCDKQVGQCSSNQNAQACADAKAKFKQYQKQYLDSLTVNSYGQCIRKTPLSNKELAALFKKYVGGQINWDAIASIDKTNYTDALLPTSNTLRELDVMLVNGNAVVQVYANQYWWVLLIIGVVLLVMLMSV
jgi:hypothetical protein